MTFQELCKVLGGGPVTEERGTLKCQVPTLQVQALSTLEGLDVWNTGFPGCFYFWAPCDEGTARYVGVVSIGPPPRKFGGGTIELFTHFD